MAFLALLLPSVVISPQPVRAEDEVYTFAPPWGDCSWEVDNDPVSIGCSGAEGFMLVDQGIVVVFEASAFFGASSVDKHLRFQIDPATINVPGEYLFEVTALALGSNYTCGGPGVGMHGGWLKMNVDYDMGLNAPAEEELINPYQTVALDAAAMAMELYGVPGASEIMSGVDDIYNNVSNWTTSDDIYYDFGPASLSIEHFSKKISIRNPALHITVTLGAQVTGSGVGIATATWSIVVAVFTELKITKIRNLEPIAEMAIHDPIDQSSVYRDQIGSLPISVTIWDDEARPTGCTRTWNSPDRIIRPGSTRSSTSAFPPANG